MEMADGSAREHVAAIEAALARGDNEVAADLAGQGLAAFPDAATFHRLRGIALLRLGANADAKEHLAAALAVDPLDNAAVLALARLADAEGDPYTAAEHLLTAWEHDPANTDLRAALTERLAALYGPEGYLQFTRPALAALYVRNAYPERAAREYRAILAEHPHRLDLPLAAALAQWRLGRLAETVEACGAVLAEQPHLVRARWALADALARGGQGEVAREHARQAASGDPDGAIARAMIAVNPDAAIVDPDEPLLVPEDWRDHLPRIVVPEPAPVVVAEAATMPEPEDREEIPPEPVPPQPEALPPKSDTMRLIEALSGLAAALAGNTQPRAEAPPEPPKIAVVAVPRAEDVALGAIDMPETFATIQLPGTEGLAEALAALDTPAPSLPDPLDVPYVPPMEQEALAETVPETVVDAIEPVVAVMRDDGAVIATMEGGEPALDAADALPTPSTPLPRREGGEIVGAHSRVPGASSPQDAAAGDPIVAMRAQVRAGDAAGAVGEMRAALAAAGSDQERVRALLPGLRALVEATPQRPDSRRLLGDAYARLGLYPQAQGQYRQALLVRVAGRGEGRDANVR